MRSQSFDVARFRAVTFDCYGTLIDWESAIPRLTLPWLAARGISVPGDVVLATFAANQKKHQLVRPALLYTELLRRTWLDVEGSFGLDPSEENALSFSRSVGEWEPFPDTNPALETFKAAGCTLGILSNVDNFSLKRTLERFSVPIDYTVTAEDVGSYKPDLPHFEASLRACERRGIARGQILHVAWSRHHDVEPCRKLGLTSVWVNRRHDKRGPGATMPSDAVPDLAVNSLAELRELFRARVA